MLQCRSSGRLNRARQSWCSTPTGPWLKGDILCSPDRQLLHLHHPEFFSSFMPYCFRLNQRISNHIAVALRPSGAVLKQRFMYDVERAFARHLDAMLHPQLTPLSHFLGDASEYFAKSSGTYGLPYIVDTTTGKRQDHNRQGDNRRRTHTEHAAEQQDSQQRVHYTNKPDGTI